MKVEDARSKSRGPGLRAIQNWAGPYRGGMSQFSESTFPDNREGSSFLTLLGIAVFLVTAGVGLALFIAGG